MTSPVTRARRLLALPVALARLEAHSRRPWATVSERRDRQVAATVELARTTEVGKSQLAGIDVRTAADLARVPCIDKEALRSVPPSAWTTGPITPGSRVIHTSGTTGHLLGVAYAEEGAWRQGVLDLYIKLKRRTTPLATRLLLSTNRDHRERGWIARLRAARAITTTDDHPATVADLIAERRPTIIHGAGGELVLIGEALHGRHGPRQVCTMGDVLTPERRAVIRTLYGTDPLDGYGMCEVGRIAWQCRARDLYHLNHDDLVVEIIDDEGASVAPGGSGELVITVLWNPLVPLVRYRTADRATLADRPCRCGHDHPALRTVDGRVMDLFIDCTGGRVAPQRLWLSLHAPSDLITSVDQYRLVQAVDRSVRLEVVSQDELDPVAAAATAASYGRLLDVPIEVVRIGALPRDRNGRIRTFTSAAERVD